MGNGSRPDKNVKGCSKPAPVMNECEDTHTVVHVASQADDDPLGSPEYRVWEYLLHEHGVNLRQYELDSLMNIARS